MEENPFNRRLNFTPSQNYEEKNPFDRHFERENEKREGLLKGILKSVSEKDPDRTGEAQRLAKELKNIEGIIVGKAIYDGDIKLEELVKELDA